MPGLLDLIAALRGGLLGTPAVTGFDPQLDGDANPIPGGDFGYGVPSPGSGGEGAAPVAAPASVPLPRPRPAAAGGNAPIPPGPSPSSLVEGPAPDFGTRLSAGLAGFANSPGPISSLVSLVGGLATGQRIDPVAQRMQLLQSIGIPPQLAPFLARNPQLTQRVVAAQLGQQARPLPAMVGRPSSTRPGEGAEEIPAAWIVPEPSPPDPPGMTLDQQMRAAPDGSIATINGVRMIKRNGQWVGA